MNWNKLISGILSVSLCVSSLWVSGVPVSAETNQSSYLYEVDLGEEGVQIGQDLFGAFFEDINAAAYGGLYAELVRNRSFEFFSTNVNNDPSAHTYGWSVDGDASMELQSTGGMNEKNQYWLEVSAKSNDSGVSNSGYDGITLQKGENYNFSMYIKGVYTGGFEIALTKGNDVIAVAEILTEASDEWTKISATLQSKEDAKDAVLCVRLKEAGSVGMDMVSLFPEHTYNNRENGLRADLVQKLKELHPGFLRFPGGCVIEGQQLSEAFNWKDSVGDVSERSIMKSYWMRQETPYYYQEYGLGFYEYFLLCEDLGCEPLPCLSAGLTCFWAPTIAPIEQMQPYIDNALDLIEFANGDANDPSQTWAKLRAEMGHPEPFNLKYLEIGNEQVADERYYQRFELFAKQINARYTDIKILSSVVGLSNGVGQPTTEWLKGKGREFCYANDEHFYMSPEWFFNNAGRYDVMDRGDDAYVFAGEYASHHVVGDEKKEDVLSAISEAAFMTGFERNADIVKLSCYAPLFCKLGYVNWDPDLIWFDNQTVYGTPSYYVDWMYGNNLGDHTLKDSVTSLESGGGAAAPKYEDDMLTGKVGVGSWVTTVEYDDILVKDNATGEILYQNDFSENNLDEWSGKGGGSWGITEQGTLKQSNESSFNNDQYVGASNWQDYTYSLRAKKISGNEGFIIPFAVRSLDTYAQFNIGGYGNTVTTVDSIVKGVNSRLSETQTVVQSNRWYEIKIVVHGNRYECYLDGKFECAGAVPKSYGPVYTTSSFDNETGDIILKMVNGTQNAQDIDIKLKNNPYAVNPVADMIRLAHNGSVEDQNSIDEPEKIIPTETQYTGVGNEFTMYLPAYSFTILRLHTKKDSERITSVTIPGIHVKIGTSPKLPKTVTANYADGASKEIPVVWESKPESFYRVEGVYEIEGTVPGYAKRVKGTVTVDEKSEEQTPPEQEKISIRKAKITAIPAQVYTGKSLKPSVTVTYKGKKLSKNKDYTLVYKNNVKIGKATVTVQGKGNYSGSISKKFNIGVKVNKKYSVGNYKYKITKADTSGKGTVTILGSTNKKLKKIKIADKVKIGGKSFKVTAIGSAAFKNYKNLTKVEIGKNVKTIGKSAFMNGRKLKEISVRGSSVKQVGKDALKGIHKKAKLKCPKKQATKYKKLFHIKMDS